MIEDEDASHQTFNSSEKLWISLKKKKKKPSIWDLGPL